VRVGPRGLACVLWLSALGCRKEAAPGAQRPSQNRVDSSMGIPISDSTSRSAARFTQEFYDWYATINDRDDQAVRDQPSLFAPELLAAVHAQFASPAKSLDERYDGLMFLSGTQETCSPYRVQHVARRGDTVLVAVKGVCADTQDFDVIAELGRLRGRWVFLDFRRSDDSTSLLQDLASLRQWRDSVRRGRPSAGKRTVDSQLDRVSPGGS